MIREFLLFTAILIIMSVGIVLMTHEKAEILKSQGQQNLDQAVSSATISHSLTCNDDEIEGYCTKEMMYKSEFEKGNE